MRAASNFQRIASTHTAAQLNPTRHYTTLVWKNLCHTAISKKNLTMLLYNENDLGAFLASLDNVHPPTIASVLPEVFVEVCRQFSVHSLESTGAGKDVKCKICCRQFTSLSITVRVFCGKLKRFAFFVSWPTSRKRTQRCELFICCTISSLARAGNMLRKKKRKYEVWNFSRKQFARIYEDGIMMPKKFAGSVVSALVSICSYRLHVQLSATVISGSQYCYGQNVFNVWSNNRNPRNQLWGHKRLQECVEHRRRAIHIYGQTTNERYW